jgi:hypothetical protein
MGFWKKRESSLGDELRAGRPEPPTELVRSIADRAPSRGPQLARRPLRIAVAGAITVALVAALGAFGGFGYASSSATHAVRTVQAVSRVSNRAHVRVVPSAAADEYAPTPPAPLTPPGVNEQAACLQSAAKQEAAFRARQAQALRRFKALQARNRAAFFAGHSSLAQRRAYVARQARTLQTFLAAQHKALHDFIAVLQTMRAFCDTLPTG